MYINLNNLTIYYEKYGNKNKNILILPGWGNTRETFYHIINHFKENYTIYIMDYPGLGNSPIPTKTLTIYDYAELIKKFMKKLNIINPLIIAHSFGGRITALLLGYYKLKIDNIILIDVAGIKHKKTLIQWLKEKTYKLSKKIVNIFPKIKQESFNKKLLKIFASKDYNALPPTMHNTFKNIIREDLTKYYKNINSNTLIIWGEKDQDTPLKDGKKINKLINNSAIIIIKKATHYSYLQNPYLINKIIENFLD